MDYQQFCRLYTVSRETYEQLALFHELVIKWQRKINLISPNTINHIWQRHILDSLQLSSYMPEQGTHPFIDLGSGAGFPAIPLAIMTGYSFCLIESDGRKAVFLEEASRQLSLPITVISERIESVNLETTDCITARACAPLVQLLAWAAPFLSPQGKCLFPKGRHYAKEIDEALADWTFDCEVSTSKTDPEAAILQLTQLTRR